MLFLHHQTAPFQFGHFYIGQHNSMEIVYANDIDDNACNIFKKNFKIVPDNRDIREVKSDEIPEFDILTGGFPCQSSLNAA